MAQPHAAVVGEPVVRQLVMHVVGVEERDEHVHIEQRNAITATSRATRRREVSG